MGNRIQQALGLGTPFVLVLPPPIIAQRAPTSNDTNYPGGQVWEDESVTPHNMYMFNSSSWLLIESGGGAGSFATLTVSGTSTLGAINATGAFVLNGAGSATTSINTGLATGAVAIGNPTGGVALGGATAVTGALSTTGSLTLSTAGTGLILNSATTSGTTSGTLNGRVGQITITTPSIAAAATFAFTLTNSSITGSGTQVGYWLTGGTTGAALTIQSYVNTASQSVITIQNGTGATTNTASLTLNFLVIN